MFQLRSRGLLLGLGDGDRNGGPIQMALQLAESLVKHGEYRPVQVMEAYVQWWDGGKGVDAWDTGPTTRKLLCAFHHDEAQGVNLLGLEKNARDLDRILNGMTAGCNAMHRVLPMALAWFLRTDEELYLAARQESRITHWSPISQLACAIATLICRKLIQGDSIHQAVQQTVHFIGKKKNLLGKEWMLLSESTGKALDGDCSIGDLDRGGFCPDVLKAAIFFAARGDSYTQCINSAIKFAGASNYCPVLVGAFAGAIFGNSSDSLKQIQQSVKPDIQKRCIGTATAFADHVEFDS
uniref:ADP-ribosylglycohydrolase n=1 Tax=Aplanochytrium stocchinoi TaxID=215587 RepID=A0A7S3UY65_9STRA